MGIEKFPNYELINDYYLNEEIDPMEIESVYRSIKQGVKNLSKGMNKEYVMNELSNLLIKKGIKFIYNLKEKINCNDVNEKAIYDRLAREKVQELAERVASLKDIEKFGVPREFINEYFDQKAA